MAALIVKTDTSLTRWRRLFRFPVPWSIAEYLNVSLSLRAGDGFANPFGEHIGPSAWMPPVLPCILAGLLWACDGNRETVMAVVVFLQVSVLVGTGYSAYLRGFRNKPPPPLDVDFLATQPRGASRARTPSPPVDMVGLSMPASPARSPDRLHTSPAARGNSRRYGTPFSGVALSA